MQTLHPRSDDEFAKIFEGTSDVFSIAFNHSPLALTITALDDGTLVAVNEAFVRGSGYTREESVGRTPDELGLWVDPERRADRFAELTIGHQVPQIEARFRLKSGEVRVGLIGSAVVEIGGRRCVLSSVLDITDRKLAEARAQERQERYELVLAGAEAAIWDWDVASHRVLFSRRWKQLRGLNDDEITDGEEEWLKRIHPDDVSRVKASVAEHFEGRTAIFAEEYRVRHKDGRWIWISDRGLARRDTEGRVVRMAGSEIDITAKKAAEQALRASEERYRAIVESQIEMVCRFRVQGEILFANAAYARARDTTAGELIGQNFWDFVDASDRPAVRAQLERLTPDAPEAVIENRFDTADGVRWTLWTNRALVFDGEGRATELQSSGIDITDRKIREREIARANEIKDEFLATLSHELRTPLNAVLGWAHMLRTGAVPAEGTAQALETLERNAQAQSQLVDDLLDMSRIVSGKLAIRRERVTLNDIARAAADTVRPAAQAKGLRLEVGIPSRPCLRVIGDRDRLRQVFWNLLANAVKFTPAGGLVRILIQRDGGDGVVLVEDTGEGIEREFLPVVFERFRQADSTTTRRHNGLGLGLAIAKHLVEAHGGTVAAHSEGTDRGATFTVRLPLA